MQLGMFMMPLHPIGRALDELLVENIEKAVLADQLGFEEVWVGEHFSIKTEPIPAPMMFMSALLDKTTHLKLGTGVVCLPQHHPAVVAAEVSMFDHLSKGRLLFGIGPGGAPSDFELFATEDGKARNAAMMESIDMILEMWSHGPPYEIEGKFWNLRMADSVMPEFGVGYIWPPYQQPHPPIALSAMSPFSGSVRTAGERGWSPISAGFIPTYSVASHWEMYQKGCEAAGRPADGDNWRVARNVFISESAQEARDHVADPRGAELLLFRLHIEPVAQGRLLPDHQARPRRRRRRGDHRGHRREHRHRGHPRFGRRPARRLPRRGRSVRHLGAGRGGLGRAYGAPERRSMELLAEKVMPRFAEATGAKAAAQ